MAVPNVSVVVSSRERLGSLQQLVRSLEAQELEPSRFEVVVVDNGYRVPVRHADLVADGSQLDLRVIRNPVPRGASSGRNLGWRAARAPLVAFTDDDCRADPGWLARLLAVESDALLSIIQGRTEPDPAHGPVGEFDHTNIVRGPNHLFETCNVAYPRELLERIGGFDESYLYAGEDVDLGWRAKAAGGELVFAADAVVFHAVSPVSLRSQLRRTTHWIDAVKVLRAHPQLRGALHWHLFWKRTHPSAVAMLVSVGLGVVGRRPWVGVLGALPWAAQHARRYRGRDGAIRELVRDLPRHAAVDTCEVATMVAGSVRYRTPVL